MIATPVLVQLAATGRPYVPLGKAGFEMLKSLNLRRRGVTVISCPFCAGQQFEIIKTVERLEEPSSTSQPRSPSR